MRARPHLRLRAAPAPLLAAALALGAAGAAAGDQAIATAGDRRISGPVVQEEGGQLVVRSGGWDVRVPAEQVLARVTDGGRVSFPAAEVLEDRALDHEARGRFAQGFQAYRAALDALLAAAADPAVPAADASALVEVALRRLHYLALQADLSPELAAACRAVLGAPRLTPYAGDAARYYRALHLRRLGRLEAARADEAALGLVTTFFVVGGFDNERGTGFDRAYGPETAPFAPAASFDGKGHRVAWRPQPVAAPPLGVVDLDALLRPDEQSLAYAVTYLHADADTDVALRLGSDGALKVWVDRTLVHSAERRRPLRFDQDHVGVRLRKGWNEVLLKVADEKGPWAFCLRVSAPAGGPVEGVRAATLAEVAAAPATAREAEARPVAGGALETLAARTAAAPDDWRGWFHLGYLHHAYQTHDRGDHPDRQALAAAARLRPDSAVLQVLLAHTLAGEAEYSVNQENNARRLALEEALRLDPEHAVARWLLASYYRRDLGNADKARRILAPALEVNPRYLDAALLMAELDEVRDLEPLATSRLRSLEASAAARVRAGQARHLPGDLLRRLLEVARERQDAARVAELYEELLVADATDAGALAGLARVHRDAGRLDAAEAALVRAVGLAPFRHDLRLDLAHLQQARGRLDAAARTLEEALALCPDEEELVIELGHLELRRGHEERAQALFDRALTLDPNQPELREYLELRARHSGAATDAFEARWAWEAEPVVAAARELPLDPRQTHRYLLHQSVAKVHADGRKSEFVQELIRVENEVGARQLSSYAAAYSSDQRLEFQRARVFRRDGGVEEVPVRTFEGRRGGEFSSYHRGAVRFPPLEPGDAVEVRYRTDDLEPGFFGDYYGNIAYFQSEQPMDRVRYVLVAPEGRTFHFHAPGFEAIGGSRDTVDAGAGLTAHLFEARDVPALESEPGQPWAKEILPQVQVSTFADWDAFARWYWGLVRGQHESDPAIRAKVEELCQGAATDEEKIRRIYHYVVSEIRYNASWEFGVHGFKPYNATRIYARKFGDCKDKATLINTMLREVGIDSYPVLIFGEVGRGREDLTLPLMSHFNHCISWVDQGEEGIFLDGTAEHHPYGTLPTMDYGAKVVVIQPEAGVVRDIPFNEPEANQVRERHVVRMRADGGATLESTIEGTGDFEVTLRGWLQTAGRRAEVLEPRVGALYPGARVTQVDCSDLEDLNEPVRVAVEVEVPRLLQKVTGEGTRLREVESWLFDALFLRGRKLSDLAAQPERDQDLILSVPAGLEETVIYELPPGTSVDRLPEPARLERPFGAYERVYERRGDQLRVRRVLRFETHRIPAGEYGAFREWLNAIQRAEEEAPILGTGASD